MRRKVTLNEAGNEYLAHLTARRSAEGTVENRRITLAQFREVVGNIQLDSITAVHIDRWRTIHAWQPTTMNRKLSELRHFFTWAKARGYMSTALDPMNGHRTERVPTKDRLRIPVDKWPALLDAAPHPLERVLIACGLYLMARMSELTGVRLRDVDLESGEITVWRPKIKRHDSLPICAELDAELRRWLTWYTATAAPGPEAYLLPNRGRSQTVRDPNTGRLTRLDNDAFVNPLEPLSRPHRNVKWVLDRAGYGTHSQGGHTLRRSGARAYFDELVDLGYDGALRRVQSMLDHSSGTMTEVYLGLQLDKEARNKALKGQPMFRRNADAANVVRLDSRRDGTDG